MPMKIFEAVRELRNALLTDGSGTIDVPKGTKIEAEIDIAEMPDPFTRTFTIKSGPHSGKKCMANNLTYVYLFDRTFEET